MLHHLVQVAALEPGPVRYLFSYGFSGVWLFFVISGFCIHLRWVRQGGGDPPHFWTFWKRRAWRLYPPYLAALALSVVLGVWQGQVAVNGFLLYDVAMHVGMVHNLDPRTTGSLNSVFWTIAIEEQLYLLYFVLLRLRRQWSWSVILAMMLVLRGAVFALAFFLHRAFNFELVSHQSAFAQWFAWALGAIAVEAHFGMLRLPAWFTSRWAVLLGAVGAVTVTAAVQRFTMLGMAGKLLFVAQDVLWGFAFFLLVCRLTRWEKSAVKLPHWLPPLAALGVWSYSLYLLHQFCVQRAKGQGSWLVAAGVTLASLAVAYLFFLLVERPSLERAKRIRP